MAAKSCIGDPGHGEGSALNYSTARVPGMTAQQDSDNSSQGASAEVDNSLRGAALRRATLKQVPKTLTPYEWEQWYAKNGVPAEHRKQEGWLQRQWARLKAALAD
ncbi:MAG: hypothetical protein Hals2KO_31270 [Halioglobus sp.]